jgi:hypothetical protein
MEDQVSRPFGTLLAQSQVNRHLQVGQAVGRRLSPSRTVNSRLIHFKHRVRAAFASAFVLSHSPETAICA